MPNTDIQQLALKLLARREHSKQELINKLKKKAFDLNEIKATVDLLEEQGSQSNERFAEAFIRERVRIGYGPQIIAMALQERGIKDTLIDQCISVYSDDFWQEQLKALWQRRFGNKPLHKTLDEKARQYRFLSYRGFKSQDIYLLLKGSFNED